MNYSMVLKVTSKDEIEIFNAIIGSQDMNLSLDHFVEVYEYIMNIDFFF